MDEVAEILEEKAEDIVKRATREFATQYPEKTVDEEIIATARGRVTSQLMFSMSNLTFPDNADKRERIDDWYDAAIEQELFTVCSKCLAEETEKKAQTAGDGLSAIDRYLQKHGMGKKR